MSFIEKRPRLSDRRYDTGQIQVSTPKKLGVADRRNRFPPLRRLMFLDQAIYMTRHLRTRCRNGIAAVGECQARRSQQRQWQAEDRQKNGRYEFHRHAT